MSSMRRRTTILCLVVVGTLIPVAASGAESSNDTRAEAAAISMLPYATEQDIQEMTSDSSDPSGCYDRPERTVWYRYTAEAAGRLVASTAGSSFGTMLEVLEGSATSLSSVKCTAGYEGNSTGSVLAFAAKKDRTYYFVIGKNPYTEAPQNWELHFALRVQPDIAVSIDDKTYVDTESGEVTVTGTAMCSEDVAVQIQPQLRQSRSKGTAGAAGAGYVECTATEEWFSVTLAGYSRGGFVDGQGTLYSTVRVPTEAIHQSTEAPASVTTCTLIGTVGDDTLTGTVGKDRICALAGDDVISGGGADDVVHAGPGEDVVRLGRGNDQALGGDGADKLVGGAGNDVLQGGRGKDVLRGGRGYDSCTGGPGKDVFRGCELRKP